jgi:hopanoid biosynthesis associated protein HpnK
VNKQRKQLVVTADDFGLSLEVNEAVERAHRQGILTAASLMVSAPATADAVTRARRLPRLNVGLHLVLVEGTPTLPSHRVPGLLDGEGRLRRDMARLGAHLVLSSSLRRQLAQEVAAQFEAFSATGLVLDHVDAHKHFHLHPLVARELVKHAERYGACVRTPLEPAHVLIRVEGRRQIHGRGVAPFARLLSRRLRRAGLRFPDQVFGLAWSGAMTRRRLLGLLAHLPAGLSEIYTHPAMRGGFLGAAAGYHYEEELAALMAPEVAAAAARAGASLGGFREFC